MFFKATVAMSLAILAVATPAPAPNTTPAPSPSQSCSTGSVQCCDSTQSANSTSQAVTGLLSLLGIIIQDITGLIGVTCSPITGVGVSGTNCAAQTVCCENDSFNGLIAIGCTPINIDL